jgi:transposase
MSTASPSPEPLAPHQAPWPTTEQLPDDPETLKRMIVELLATLRERTHDLEEARQRLQQLVQRLYGPRRERFNPAQLLLFSEINNAAPTATTEPAPPESSQEKAGHKRCRPHGRRRLPQDLPRQVVHHELTEAERRCPCGHLRIDIGAESGGEQLDWRPASYFVWQHVIHKYLCPNCASPASLASPANTATPEPAAAATPAATESVTALPVEPLAEPQPPASGPVIIAAPRPPLPIAKGLPGAGLLAQVIVSKYFDHLPLYRQENISERQGVCLPRSTSCDWMAACAELLRPLQQRMTRAVLQSLWLHTDDTKVQNLGHAPGTTKQARFWVYAGDRDHPYNVFDFTLNRRRDGPQTFLADFHGYLHADAFSGYDALYLPSADGAAAPIKEVACNAHARRKFYEARGSDESRSHQALAYYGQLYELERVATTGHFNDAQRLRLRQELALPILATFQTWLEAQRGQVLPKSPMAEAIGYALHNWAALVRYTEAGFLSIDNNVAEREMKRIAIGRKNWLFVGSSQGGRTAAVLFSFTSTCHRLHIEPWAYLKDVLTRLPRTSPEHLDELLPDRWQAARRQATNPQNEVTPTIPSPS